MRGWVLLFSLILAAAAPLGLARADCAGEQCIKPIVSYGAIAYGAKRTAYGTSSDQHTRQEAERSALAECRENADDCTLVASFANGCAAVAAIESKGVYSTGNGDTRARGGERRAQDLRAHARQRLRDRGLELRDSVSGRRAISPIPIRAAPSS